MTNHKQNRAALLHMIDAIPAYMRKGQSFHINEQDYVGVPLPRNLTPAPHGDCLIWLASLNDDGYGVGTFPSGEKLAHREAFRDSRGYSGENILHLCHRPYCIQPSHLYAGSKQDNADDRRLRQTNSPPPWDLFMRANDEVRKALKFRWPCPEVQRRPLISTDVSHDCEFIVPAGYEKICSICSEPQSQELRGDPTLPDFQPGDTDRNRSAVVATSRRFTDLGGFTVESNIATKIDMPKTRAESRRIEMKQRKFAKKRDADKPVLLDSTTHLVGPDGLRVQGETPPLNIPGPGFVVWAVSSRPVSPELATHLDKKRGVRAGQRVLHS